MQLESPEEELSQTRQEPKAVTIVSCAPGLASFPPGGWDCPVLSWRGDEGGNTESEHPSFSVSTHDAIETSSHPVLIDKSQGRVLIGLSWVTCLSLNQSLLPVLSDCDDQVWIPHPTPVAQGQGTFKVGNPTR